MNKLEKDYLAFFLTNYQKLTFQIENHKKYREELSEEIERVENELFLLSKKKEEHLTSFVEIMLRNASKNSK